MSKIIVLIIILLLTISSSHAFDGDRKGFVLGGGIGVSPHTSWEIKDRNINQSHQPSVINFVIGYGLNSQNLIVWEGLTSSYRSSVLENSKIYQGFGGINWFYYFTDKSRNNPFMSIGVCRVTFDTKYTNLNSTGFGIVVGGGLEIKRHYQLGFNLGIGKSSYEDYDNIHKIITITFTAIAF